MLPPVHRSRAALLLLALTASAAAAQSPVPTWTLVPELRIDATRANLSDVGGITAFPNGSIAVSQPDDSRILFFNAAGAQTGSVGRKGEGPGEFRSLWGMGRAGAMLWIYDIRLARVTLVSPSGKVAETLRLPGTVTTSRGDTIGLPGMGFPLEAVYQDGSLLVRLFPPSNRAAAPNWHPLAGLPTLITITRNGVLQHVIGTLESNRACTVDYGRGSNAGIPFCVVTQHWVSGDGSHIAIVGQRNPTGPVAHYAVAEMSSHGDTIFSRTFSSASIAIPNAVIDSEVTRRVGRQPENRDYVKTLRAMTMPRWAGPVHDVLVGDDGTIWLGIQEQFGLPTHRYNIFDATGKIVATVVPPSNVRPWVVSKDQMWGVDRDADGLESVVRYRVERGRGAKSR